ncbi:hypothetical protein B0I37DRAFT_11592 [Chaetomium sp. MPI-CAGE-AT-0009]|nr:hypothetical protein B0I37DRAFT_11592 [Chaetomium sp. MPI-CAGE-AT-0009]
MLSTTERFVIVYSPSPFPLFAFPVFYPKDMTPASRRTDIAHKNKGGFPSGVVWIFFIPFIFLYLPFFTRLGVKADGIALDEGWHILCTVTYGLERNQEARDSQGRRRNHDNLAESMATHTAAVGSF